MNTQNVGRGSRRARFVVGGIRHSVSGFTLVELLVVIAIIGVLIALLLPAIQAAREAARISQCKNNLGQIGKAWQMHHSTQKFFPTGGWGWNWTGDPDRGFDVRQPGGWMYNILPFMEQNTVHDMGKGETNYNTKLNIQRDRLKVPLTCYTCPSRRKAEASGNTGFAGQNSAAVTLIYRADYAACAGDEGQGGDCPSSPGQRGAGPLSGGAPASPTDPPFSKVYLPGDTSGFTLWGQTKGLRGCSFARSMIRDKDVKDGLSKTYIVAEKHVLKGWYSNGYVGTADSSDNEGALVGMDDDTYKSTCADFKAPPQPNTPDSCNGTTADCSPLQDVSQSNNTYRFGAVHSGGFSATFADGSVHFIPYSVDPEIHRRFGTRAEGYDVDLGQIRAR
jgi:prepilin-type N-terminal cleavage/methylation domain-containing protein